MSNLEINTLTQEQKIESNEIWAPVNIPGFTEYMVSTYGNVMKKNGSGLLKQFQSRNGYMMVGLRNKDREFHALVHRLVALAFIPLPEKFIRKKLTAANLVVNHKDGKKTNNRVDNLEWVMVKGNMDHAKEHGLLGYMGENSHLAKMTNSTAEKCCKMLAKGKSFNEIAEKLGISKKTVAHIKYGETWTHISKKYTFPKNDQPKPNSIDPEVIHAICKMLDEGGHSDPEIAGQFGVTREYVRDIRLGKRQKKISQYYNFLKNSFIG